MDDSIGARRADTSNRLEDFDAREPILPGLLQVQSFDLVACNIYKDVVKILAGEALFDLRRSSGGQDPACMKKEDTITDFLDVLHIVLRVQNL